MIKKDIIYETEKPCLNLITNYTKLIFCIIKGTGFRANKAFWTVLMQFMRFKAHYTFILISIILFL